jgi:hypothetical protein
LITYCGILSYISSSVKIGILLGINFQFREENTDCCRESSFVGGSGTTDVPFLTRNFWKERDVAREHCHGEERSSGIPTNVAICFRAAILSDNFKVSIRHLKIVR